ncbi:MAG: DUF3574 domain-containing protein [Candidatus Manganitrophus sp.]|nr:DUF3574 domain-containing protein [Candidatus Manganitrophus sp.]
METPARSLRSIGRQGTVLISDTLFFGLSTARGPVGAAEWNDFLRDIVTPRFPDGFTYWEANGQWRGADNRLVQERSMVFQIVHPDNFQAESAIQEIIHRYQAAIRARFGLAASGCGSGLVLDVVLIAAWKPSLKSYLPVRRLSFIL